MKFSEDKTKMKLLFHCIKQMFYCMFKSDIFTNTITLALYG